MRASDVRLILNPDAGGGARADELRALAADRGWPVVETRRAGEGASAAVSAARDGVRVVAAVGGDGTINDVLQGLMRLERRPRLAIVPLGTGNDLARTLELPSEPSEALALLAHAVPRALDVIEVAAAGAPLRYALNICAGGFAGAIEELLDDNTEVKQRWGPLAYLRGAVGALPDLEGHATCIICDGGAPMWLDAFNVVVANGRSAGGGALLAPDADPTDGLLDVIVVREAPASQIAGMAARFLVGDYREAPCVWTTRCAELEVRSTPPMTFNVDGDLHSRADIRFRVLPAAVEVLVARDSSMALDAGSPQP